MGNPTRYVEHDLNKRSKTTKALNPGEYKEILESFLFCMYLGSFTLPLSTKLNEYS